MQSHAEEIREGILCSVASNLERMGTMGRAFIHYVNERLPTVPVEAKFQSSQDPWTYLPPLSKRLAKIVADYGEMQ
jgi:hypothetical protein